jgi:tripartite-type tricarboxylate transporter receptor subunit TctC
MGESQPTKRALARNLALGVCIAVNAGALALAALPVSAQEFPVKTVRVIAPFPAGGGTDINVRRLSDRLSKIWKQPVIVENIAGGAGNSAAVTVALSQPDGYVLFFASLAIFAVNPVLYDKLPFDPDRDFAPVVLVSDTPHVLLVNSTFPATTVSELIALAKARPGRLNFGSGGQGTSLHLAGELLKTLAGIDLTHIPYKGTTPAVTAMIGNEIQMLFDSASSAIGHIRGGRVRGLAIASVARIVGLPEVPTFEESGIPGFYSGVGNGILVRAGTPAVVVSALNRSINAALNDPEYKKQMADIGVNLAGGTPEQLRSYIAAERKKWTSIIQKQGIKAS